MSSSSSALTCRLTVIGPQRRLDTSVPAAVPLIDVLPTLLTHLGHDLADHGLDHGGWVLQRLGDPPLDVDLSCEDLGLLDGDVLHLLPRSDTIPPIDFDDLVDGLATGMRQRAGLWRPTDTRRAAGATVGLILVAGVAAVALPGDPVGRCAAAWLTALALLPVPLLRARGGSRRAETVLVAVAALVYATAGLMLVPAAARQAGQPAGTGLLPAVLGIAVVVVASAVTVFGRRPAVWVALGVGGSWCLAGGAAAVIGGGATAAAVVICLAALVRPAVPRLAFRLAGLQLDALPATAEDLQSGIDPRPGEATLAAAERVDQVMTALYAGPAVAGGAAMVWLAGTSGWPGLATVAAAATAQLLAVRAMTSTWHRLALAGPALLGLLVAVLAVAAGTGPGGRLAVLGGLLLAAAAVAVIGHRLVEGRLSPVPGRLGDLVHLLAGVALIPAALWASGVLSLARNLAG